MRYVIMRSDLSSILHEEGKMLVFTNLDVASKYAKPYCGIVIKHDEAIERLLLTNRFTLTAKARQFFHKFIDQVRFCCK